jgi:hypothetical protein
MRACVEGRIGTAWALRLNELVAIDDEESLTGVGLSILRGKAPPSLLYPLEAILGSFEIIPRSKATVPRSHSSASVCVCPLRVW